MKCEYCGQNIDKKVLDYDFEFKILGHTKRKNGFNYFKTIEMRSPIYEHPDKSGRIFLVQTKELDGFLYPIIYKRDQLEYL